MSVQSIKKDIIDFYKRGIAKDREAALKKMNNIINDLIERYGENSDQVRARLEVRQELFEGVNTDEEWNRQLAQLLDTSKTPTFIK